MQCEIHDAFSITLCTRNRVVFKLVLRHRVLPQAEFFLNVILDHKLNSSLFFSRFIAAFYFLSPGKIDL